MSRDLILLALSMMTWGVGEGMFYLFQPLYLQELGASPLLIGSILGIVGIAMTVVHIPAGYLADRFGRRPLLWTAWIVGTIATLIMAAARSLPFFVLGSVMYGLTYFVAVPLNSYITAARGKQSVSRALTLISAAFNLGATMGPLIGGWVGDRVGLKHTFVIAAGIFILSTSIIFFIRPQPVDPGLREQDRISLGDFTNRRMLQYLTIVFLVMFAMYLPQPLSQNFLQNERGLSLTEIGQLISARSLGIVSLSLILGQLNARVGFIISQAVLGLMTIMLWQGRALPGYFLGYFLMGGYQIARLMATAQGRALLHSGNMGLGYGLIETATAAAISLAPPLAGRLYAISPTLIYSAGLALIVIAICATVFFNPLRSHEIV